jgi:hypothetical protein
MVDCSHRVGGFVTNIIAGCSHCNMCLGVIVQARPEVRPAITDTVVATMRQVRDEPGIAREISALVTYIEDRIVMRNVLKRIKQWDDDRQVKVSAAIATAMTQWDEEHYPRLLQATWGWHPFYASFVANPLCSSFRPAYPLYHSVVEGLEVHSQLLQQGHVGRVYPVPWSVLLLRSFLQFHSLLPPLISHPFIGGSVSNVTNWMKLAHEDEGEGSFAWRLARRYLKKEGFIVFAGARPVDSQQEWSAEVDAAWLDFKNPFSEWWNELQRWCQTTQFRAVQDMAFHDKASWLNAWVIRDRPASILPPLACYDEWLQHREDLDIGCVLANPGSFHTLFLQPDSPISTSKPKE